MPEIRDAEFCQDGMTADIEKSKTTCGEQQENPWAGGGIIQSPADIRSCYWVLTAAPEQTVEYEITVI